MRLLLMLAAGVMAAGQTIHKSGVVIDVTTGEGIEGAIINDGVSTTTSDFAGRFQIDSRGPGIAVSKPGYVPQGVTFGEQLPGAPGETYQVHMILRMLALSTITGTVLDAAGNPSPGARMDFNPTGRTPRVNGTADSEGRFQAQVMPGEYRVCANPTLEPKDPARIAVAVCYPSAPDCASATIVTVAPGATSAPLTIRLREEAVYTIRGRIRGAKSGWGVQVEATSDDAASRRPGFSGAYFGCVKRDGSFTMEGVPAGTYTLSAWAGPELLMARCDAKNEPDYVPIEIADDMQPARPNPPVWSGERKVTVKADVRGIAVKVARLNRSLPTMQ